MRTVIAGSRTITDYRLVEAAIAQAGFPITEVVSGTAPGVDQLGERFAAQHGVPVRRFPAEWAKYGRSAGPRRNLMMLAYARQAADGGAVIALWDGASPGTRHTIEAARQQGLRLFVFRTDRACEVLSDLAGQTFNLPTRCWRIE